MENVEQRVKKIVAEQLGVNEAEMRRSLFVDDLGAHPLDTVELVMALRRNSSNDKTDEEAEKITTVESRWSITWSAC